MLSPGGGAGNKAAAVQTVKALLPVLLHASIAFEAGSKGRTSAHPRRVGAQSRSSAKAEEHQHGPGENCATLAQKRAQGAAQSLGTATRLDANRQTTRRHANAAHGRRSGGCMSQDYLKPKVRVGNLSTRTMEEGIARNPPLYTSLGGFTSASKFNDPQQVCATRSGGPSLEKGGPSSQKGKPI